MFSSGSYGLYVVVARLGEGGFLFTHIFLRQLNPAVANSPCLAAGGFHAAIF